MSGAMTGERRCVRAFGGASSLFLRGGRGGRGRQARPQWRSRPPQLSVSLSQHAPHHPTSQASQTCCASPFAASLIGPPPSAAAGAAGRDETRAPPRQSADRCRSPPARPAGRRAAGWPALCLCLRCLPRCAQRRRAYTERAETHTPARERLIAVLQASSCGWLLPVLERESDRCCEAAEQSCGAVAARARLEETNACTHTGTCWCVAGFAS